MYKAIHSYAETNKANTLTFHRDDVLCVLEETNSSWWLASDSIGNVGYVPKSYLQAYNQINSPDTVIQSIERAILAVNSEAKGGPPTTEQKALLRKLMTHKQNIMTSQSAKVEAGRRKAPAPPSEKSPKNQAPPPPERKTSTKSKSAPNPPTSQQGLLQPQTVNEPTNVSVPEGLGQEIFDTLEEKCKLPASKLRDLIHVCLDKVGASIPELFPIMTEIISTLPDAEVKDPEVESLGLAFANLAEIKDDAQQRNWAISDDKGSISQLLQEILSKMSTLSSEESMGVLEVDQFTPLNTLATYYQMEPRVEIRILISQVLGLTCSFSPKCISVLLSSVLPDELAREIKDHINDIERVCYSALVLSMIFSTGEPIPVSYYETIGCDFMHFIVDCIEEGVPEDTDERLKEIFVRLLLAINLHFVVPTENLLLKVISSKSSCAHFSESIMLAINRGDDPVPVTDYTASHAPPHSILKFLQDIFSLPETAESFLYTNDLHVLVDIIVRNITDLSAGHKLRTEYLDLLLNLVKNSTYMESKHRSSEISSLLVRIMEEEVDLDDEEFRNNIEFDKTIVSSILEVIGNS